MKQDMKQKLILLMFILFFLSSQKVLGNSINAGYNNSNLNKNGLIKFNAENEIDPEILLKKYKTMLAVNTAMSVSGGLFITAGLLMGFIPVQYYDNGLMTYSPAFGGIISYPNMTIYAGIGISLIIAGAIMALVCLPFVFYAVSKLYYKNKINDHDKNSKKSFAVPEFEIRIEQNFIKGK
jgi:hypothetical protein